MLKYYISIGLVGVLILIIVGVGISIAGNPVSQKDIQLDNLRTSAFDAIKNKISNYYEANGKLPSSLNELGGYNPQDPETQDEFEYKAQPPYDYQLCATFSTDNSEEIKRNAYSYNTSYSARYQIHKKGYDCMTFKIDSYTITNYKKTIAPTITQKNIADSSLGVILVSPALNTIVSPPVILTARVNVVSTAQARILFQKSSRSTDWIDVGQTGFAPMGTDQSLPLAVTDADSAVIWRAKACDSLGACTNWTDASGFTVRHSGDSNSYFTPTPSPL